jgi:hypothetical protein
MDSQVSILVDRAEPGYHRKSLPGYLSRRDIHQGGAFCDDEGGGSGDEKEKKGETYT